ncbi:GNAT family N-acetyltransferase, partial [Photobacterium japonica]|uniref:GNAT family N-acetyltransferase n=1 Tax=Photobacterium japonica TaxID=2910235 RepID=UPI003D0B044E
MDTIWESESLVFSDFSVEESALAKSIFDSNRSVKDRDPTFREWPIKEFESLIHASAKTCSPTEKGAFYLKKISTKQGEVIGYIQLEINVPDQNTLWLPMLSILPKYQNSGLG